MLEGFGKKDAASEAATAEFGRQFAGLDLEQLDAAVEDIPLADSEPEPEPEPEPEYEPEYETEALPPYPGGAVDLQLDTSDRPNLEPVGDDAHPPENRRMPTQPPSALTLDLGDLRPPSQAAPTATAPADDPPQPPKLPPRQSPAPVRRGLFAMDRPTNLLAGAAIGLLLAIFPAKKFARNYEVSEVEPMIVDLEGAVDHPLGVDAGLVEDPKKIAARIDDGRKKVRRRYMTIWLSAGLLLGAGLGFAPRPGD